MIWLKEFCNIPSLVRHFRALLRSCSRDAALEMGRKLHATAITTGLLALSFPNSFLRNTILRMYAACGVSSSARQLFGEIPQAYKDIVDWTALMNCYNRTDLQNETPGLFIDMRKLGVLIDDVTMVLVFSACTKLRNQSFGRQSHACLIKMGAGYSVKACNSTMDMYVKCGLMHEATRVFNEINERNIVSWTVRLEGAVKWEGLNSARSVFDEMPERNEVSWTKMIVACVENALLHEAFRLLQEMMFGCGLGLNFVTLCSLLSACTQLGDATMGRWIHVYALKMMEKEMDVMVAMT